MSRGTEDDKNKSRSQWPSFNFELQRVLLFIIYPFLWSFRVEIGATMAISKLAILSIFLALVFSQVHADVSADAEAEHIVQVVRSDDSEFADLKVELDELKFKIQKLG